MTSSKGVACDNYAECNDMMEQLIGSRRIDAVKFTSPSGTTFVVSGEPGDKGIFIEVTADPLRDHLNEIQISTECFSCDGAELEGLFISTDSSDKEALRIMCEIATDLIRCVDRSNGNLDSEAWFNGWRMTIGNVVSEKAVYDVVGEMLVLAILQEAGKNPIWAGPKYGRHDIVCSDSEYEVKSTIVHRLINQVTVSSGRQLDPTPGKELYVVTCMFEPSKLGLYSIDRLSMRLVDAGYPEDELERALENLDMHTTFNRKKTFQLVCNPKQYPVNSDFPSITEKSFVGGHIPDHISDIKYTINLDESILHFDFGEEFRQVEFDRNDSG